MENQTRQRQLRHQKSYYFVTLKSSIIEVLQPGTSIGSLELPVHTLLTVVSLGMPRRKFLVKFFDTVYAPFCQTLVPEDREFNLSYVKPTAMLGSVVYFKTLYQAESLRRFKRLVKGCDIVSIEIVTYKYDLLYIWVSLVKQPLDAFCPVSSGSLLLCYSLTPSGQRFSEKEDAAGAIPHIFVVFVSYTCTVGSKPSLAYARSWTGFSSIHTTGCLASYGRLYTSRTSSIAATKAALWLAGIHQHFFR